MTTLVRPRSLAEALELRAAHPDYMVMAGCTDLMVNANHRAAPAGILDLWRLPGLGGVTVDASGARIGAGTTWLEVQRAAPLAPWSPLIAAAREIGALQIQARATLGGNVGTSSPVGEPLPALLALDAELEVASIRGTRRIPYREFCTGYRKTALAADELIVSAHLPAIAPHTHLAWKKVGTRRAQSISKVMGAAAIVVDGGEITDALVALGAVADRPIRLSEVEQAVRGLAPARAADAARQIMRAVIRPIDDIRSTAAYRLGVAENLVARFFSDLMSYS
ncbi:MAG: FAD binding domain-containing protein [Kofleriaceae bacterium]